MRKTFLIERFASLLIVVGVVAVGQTPRTGRIHITEGDPRDLTLYKGPTNDYRPGGNPLPSYILKAKPNEEVEGGGLYGYVGSKKPEWNDDTELKNMGQTNDVIQYFTLDCYPDEPCSQTIPIDVDSDAEIGRPNLVTHADSDFGNNNEIDTDFRNEQFMQDTENRINGQILKEQKVEVPITKEPTRYTMGPSVASVYGTNGLGPHYPVTKRPQEAKTTMTEPRYVSTIETEPPTILYPSNYRQNKYDPFSFHQNKLKRGSNLVPPGDSRSPYQQEPPAYAAHYTDSRTFSSASQPTYTYKDSVLEQPSYSFKDSSLQRLTSTPQVPLRNSLTWKGSKNANVDKTVKRQSAQFADFEAPERFYSYNSGYGNHRRQDVQSAEVHQNPNVRKKEPNSGVGYFPSYQDDYEAPETTTERPRVESNVPKRDYFPTKHSSQMTQDYDLPQDDYESFSLKKNPPKVVKDESYYDVDTSERNKYVGDPTMLNAGIVVTEPLEETDFVSSYDERYGWAHSGRGSSPAKKVQQPQQPPAVPSAVNPWTSIEEAKPQWEEQVRLLFRTKMKTG